MRLTLLLIAGVVGCESAPPPRGESSAKPTAAVARSASASPAASKGSPSASTTPDSAWTVADLSSVGEAFIGLSIRGPGHAEVSKDTASWRASVNWSAAAAAPQQFHLEISKSEGFLADFKKWADETARGFSTPAKMDIVTNKPDEFEYVMTTTVDGQPNKSFGYATTVKVGAEPFACTAVADLGQSVPLMKSVCRSLARD